MKTTIAAALLISALPVMAMGADTAISLPADNPYAALRPGPGREIAQSQCQACHSTDYIVTQPRGDAKQWDALVTKMIKVFGAPISEQDAKVIVEYLTTAYGSPR